MARRILSICPNSASVERLWSVFGTILTKLRTRLGNETLLSLAELKLYLREEHLQANAVKNRLKRKFGAIAPETPSEAHPMSPENPSESHPMFVDNPISLPNPSHTAVPDDGGENTTRNVERSIHGIVNMLVNAVEMDNDLPPTPISRSMLIPIKDLFDFTQVYWVEAYEKHGMWGLQEELELCELLDLDAEGDTVEEEADDILNE